MDVLSLVLEPYMTAGIGTPSRIRYMPDVRESQNGERPPEVALFHELVHAYYNATGRQLGGEESLGGEQMGARLFELMAMGLPPFEDRQFHENRLRDAWPWRRRIRY